MDNKELQITLQIYLLKQIYPVSLDKRQMESEYIYTQIIETPILEGVINWSTPFI